MILWRGQAHGLAAVAPLALAGCHSPTVRTWCYAAGDLPWIKPGKLQKAFDLGEYAISRSYNIEEVYILSIPSLTEQLPDQDAKWNTCQPRRPEGCGADEEAEPAAYAVRADPRGVPTNRALPVALLNLSALT